MGFFIRLTPLQDKEHMPPSVNIMSYILDVLSLAHSLLLSTKLKRVIHTSPPTNPLTMAFSNFMKAAFALLFGYELDAREYHHPGFPFYSHPL